MGANEDVTGALLRQATRGDTVALDRLLDRHLPALRAYIRLNAGRAVRDRESVSDLAQSVVREVLEAGDGYEYRGEAAFRNWLYTAALRKIVARDRYWHAGKRDVRREAPSPDRSDADDARLLDCYMTFCSPSKNAVVHEQRERIERAFDQLPEDARNVILQSRILGVSHGEIARQMNRSEGAVRVLLHRALARLARILDET